MIAITIKTLDSRNHEFSVEDDLTVKQLKERIAESVNVVAESQRLIYCGRVLLDDKKLSEYDVNGKVIHLVQRAPPSSSGGGSSSSNGTTSGRSGERMSRGRLDNAMYLGAMAFPADLMEAQGLAVPPARHTLSHSRLGVARAMLRRANTVLQALEGRSDQSGEATSSSDPPTPAEPTTPTEPAQEINIQAEVNLPVEPSVTSSPEPSAGPRPEQIAAAAAEAVTAALGHALSVHHGGNVSITLNNGDGNSGDDLVVSVTPGSSGGAGIGGGSAGARPRPAPQRTTALADLVSQLRDVQRRMEPFLDRYYNLMHQDPPETSENHQQVFNQVSELMHLLAHAYHALSDIMCDLSQPPPRVLRCRPVLIQHSAVLQTGIPIQVGLPAAQIINVSTRPSNNSHMESDSQAEGQNNTNQPQARSEEPPRSSDNPPSQGESQAQTGPRAEAIVLGGPRPNQASSSSGGGPTATFSISPSNLEIFMDVSSGSITLDSVEATVLHAAPPPPSSNPQPPAPEQPPQGVGISGGDANPWGQPPPNDFIQSFFHRIYGEMSNIHNNNYSNTNNNSSGSGGSSASSSRPQSASASGPANASTDRDGEVSQPQSSPTPGPGPGVPQARATFSRPHIHIGGPHIQTGYMDFFDPFLPCNSHHIRGRRRGAGSSSATNTAEEARQASESSANPSVPDQLPSGSSGPNHPTLQMTLLPSGQNRTRSIVHHIIPILPREIVRNLQTANGGSSSIMRSTLAQLLESIPGQPYTPGQSLIMDLIMTAGRNVMLQDVMCDVSPAMLSWMRPGLREYLENSLGVDASCPDAAVESAVERINAELSRFFETPFDGLTMREDVDLPASIRKVSQACLPLLIKDIHQADNFTYSMNVSQIFLEFIRGIISVLAYTSQTSRGNIDAVILAFAYKLINGSTAEVRTWLVGEVAARIHQVIFTLDLFRDVHRQFIVNVPPPQANTQADFELDGRIISGIEEHIEDIHPMDVDGIEEAPQPEVISTPARDRDPLPNVVIGSEPWHHDIPADWVPIITRDRERQRRSANQGPLSDAYLAGMPSKRRKLLTDAKPNSTLSKVISESMGRAIGAAGLAPCPDIVEEAVCDTSLRSAYKAQVRLSVESTLRSHPDYHPDKYPNTAKYFNRLHH